MEDFYCQVTLEFDGRTFISPLSYFKDKEQVFKELTSFKIRPSYDVFWSPIENDTPEKLLERERKILHQDQIKLLVKDGARKKVGNPQAGWYKAKINQWDENLDKLVALLDETVGRKVREGMQVIPAQTKSDRSIEKRDIRILKEKARKITTTSLITQDDDDGFSDSTTTIQKSSKARSKKRKRNNSLSDEEWHNSDSDTELFYEHQAVLKELKQLKGELKKYKSVAIDEEILSSLQKENVMLKKQNNKLIELNIYWQEHVMKRNKRHSSSSKKGHSKEPSSSHSKPSRDQISMSAPFEKQDKLDDVAMSELDFQVAEENGAVRPTLVQVGSESSQNQNTNWVSPTHHQNNTLEQGNVDGRNYKIVEAPPRTSVPPSNVFTSQKAGKGGKSSSAFGGIKISESEFSIKVPDPAKVKAITFSQFTAIAGSVATGPQGDSQFYKNCASCLWEDIDLAARSVTGAACPNDLSKTRKVECTPEKKTYLKDLLELRIKSELRPVTEEEKKSRLSSTQLNNFLRQKIKTVQRALKLKEAQLQQ